MRNCIVKNNKVIMFFEDQEEDRYLRDLVLSLGVQSIALRLKRYLLERKFKIQDTSMLPKWFIKKVVLDEMIERFESQPM